MRLTEIYAVLGPLYRRTARVVESADGIEGASVGVRAVLEILRAEGPQPVPRIAETLALSRQFVQRMTDDAHAGGLVELRPNPRHKRSRIVMLTAAGQQRTDAIKAREHAALRTIDTPISSAEIDACMHVLRTLDAAIRTESPP